MLIAFVLRGLAGVVDTCSCLPCWRQEHCGACSHAEQGGHWCPFWPGQVHSRGHYLPGGCIQQPCYHCSSAAMSGTNLSTSCTASMLN